MLTEGQKLSVREKIQDYLIDPVTQQPTHFFSLTVEKAIDKLISDGHHDVRTVNNGDKHFVGKLTLDVDFDFCIAVVKKSA